MKSDNLRNFTVRFSESALNGSMPPLSLSTAAV